MKVLYPSPTLSLDTYYLLLLHCLRFKFLSPETFNFLTMAASVLPYELYSDAPGTLFNKPEWEAANAAHPAGFDFGPLPEGWPKKIESDFVWDGKDFEAHPEKFLRVLNDDEIAELDVALKVLSLSQQKNSVDSSYSTS